MWHNAVSCIKGRTKFLLYFCIQIKIFFGRILRLMSYKYIKMNLILLEKRVTLLLLNTFFIISILQAVFMYLTILFTCRVNNYHFGSLALKSNYIKDNIFSLPLLGKSPTCRVNNYLS